MGFRSLLAAQWRCLSLSWLAILLHVAVYALLCVVLSLTLNGASVWQYLDRMILVIAVSSAMIQMGSFVARLLWLGVAIGEAGWLVSRCTALALPSVPVGLIQLLYAGLLLVLFVLLSRAGGNGGLPTFCAPQPLTPSRSPVRIR
ncbi:hypothetical protein [Gloeobacter kilaueensis]|uniref:Uncharacterized protein n=1 Tax=Gloeobacter kilaueensis (strain ATCC BAA-2537 / CCAP 1431/1 / ULC 316 / JS1) TaxID=1183438 RepID=U5QIT2_GLOK1|nr:hypothetical protein [Gloeobacter kilaueensis]AGY58806.1 hypothetical protein GKIL_2560 [Gloeobacter kilaueensis JS1]